MAPWLAIAVALADLTSSLATARPPAWRLIRTIQGPDGIVWRVQATPRNRRRGIPARLKLTAVAPRKPPVELVLLSGSEAGGDEDPGSFSDWKLHESVEAGGRTFLILENDDAAADHRSVDYWLYGFGCGRILKIAELAHRPGFDFDARTVKSLARLVELDGPPGARWKGIVADYRHFRWSESACEYLLLEDPEPQ